jgi:hypothetical protein
MTSGVTTRNMYSSLQIQINNILLHLVGQLLTQIEDILQRVSLATSQQILFVRSHQEELDDLGL